MPLATGFLFYASNHWLGSAGALASVAGFLKQFLSLTRIDCMALGGVAAYCLFLQKDKLLSVIFHPAAQIINLTVLALILYSGFYLPYANNILHGLVFGILILNLGANKKPLINLEWKPLRFLGKISFGIYMYHPICIFLSMKILRSAQLDAGKAFPSALLCVIVFGITILMAALSYKFFEAPFLRLKPHLKKTAPAGLSIVPE